MKIARCLVLAGLTAILVARITAWPASAHALNPNDVFEPNDSPASATLLIEGVTQQHFVEQGVDVDWFSFPVLAGRTYTIGTDPLSSSQITHGTQLFLFSEGGDGLANDLEYYGDSQITFTARRGGTFYLMVVGITLRGLDPIETIYNLTLRGMDVAPPSSTLTRIQGANRYATAEAIARKQFPGWRRADGSPVDYVVIASGEDRSAVDALGAASLAGALDAPVLLVPYRRDGRLPTETLRAIKEMWATSQSRLNTRVIGGSQAVSWETESALYSYRSRYTSHERIFGPDRYETAGRIADRVDQLWRNEGYAQSPTVFVADGRNESFHDALAASPITASGPIPLLLTQGSSIPAATSRRLAASGRFGAVEDVWVVNAASRVSDGAARQLRAVNSDDGAITRLTNSIDRSQASVDIAYWGTGAGYLSGRYVGVANGTPDAISSGSFLGSQRAGLIYCNATSVPAATQAYLGGPLLGMNGYVFGGTNAISATTFDKMSAYLR